MARKKKSRWTKIKSKIGKLEKKDFVALIKELYSLNNETQTFLDARFGADEEALEACRKAVEEAIYPDVMNDGCFDVDQARKAIQLYAQASGDEYATLDLMVSFVEAGNQYTLDYGDINEHFYDSLIEMYAETIRRVKKLPQKEQDDYAERLHAVMTSADGIGWGYYDSLCDIFCRSFADD